MGTEEECKLAIKALDNQEIGGRPIVVNHAHRRKNEVVRPARKRNKAKAAS